jgi:insulysin
VNSLDDARFRAKALLLVQMVSEKCFNQLRTQEQLGYEVSFDFYQKHDCVGFDVFIVSANHSPEFLNVRIEEFLVNVMNELHSISDSDFKDLKAGLHDELHDVDHNLSELGERLWGEIQELAFQFDRIERVLAEMEPVAKVDVLELFRQAFLDKARRRLSVQIYACKHKMQSEDSEDKDSFESKVILDSIPAISKAKASLL